MRGVRFVSVGWSRVLNERGDRKLARVGAGRLDREDKGKERKDEREAH